MIDDIVEEIISVHCPEDKDSEEWDTKGLKDSLYGTFSVSMDAVLDNFQIIKDAVSSEVKKAYEKKEGEAGQ